ncbi:glycosyltransferase family 4 protein [Sphingobium sp. DEHP117]|nr:glycosyltransferase family 4 protein [Sphingobium sp. DEHP117]
MPFAASRVERATNTRCAIALIGTFAPRKCGIATFTKDIFDQLLIHQPEITAQVYALDTRVNAAQYEAVTGFIDCDSPASYAQAAQRINAAGYDAVWLQHEFGIFGGPDGEMVCDFVDRLAAPLIVTFHTVLESPSDNQRRITEHLVTRASRIMVMSQHGRDLLVDQFHAPATLVEVIPHGAPDRPFGREELMKERLNLSGKQVLMTFGLIGPGKGLENAIEALPAIVASHPNAIYRIVGATHPNLVREQGEGYRDGLQALAERLGVADHIQWENRFLDTPELLDQLEACDIYLTPYFNLQQATSGTLSYAVALGKAVVSTPYVHARELLADGAGVLVEPKSSEAIAQAVNRLLDDADELNGTKQRAFAAGRKTIWPHFAAASAGLVRNTLNRRVAPPPVTAAPSLAGVWTMCDHTGMLQHGIGIVPDRRHGYCIDDNARALILMNQVRDIIPSERTRWSIVFASFIQHAWNPDKQVFRNFMAFDRAWCEDAGSEDSNGRTIWALGHTAACAADADIRSWGRRWFETALPGFAKVDSPRAIAFAMLGAVHMLSAEPGHVGAKALLERGGAMLAHLLHHSRRPNWAWFEAVLGYDNPRLPQALIEAGSAFGRQDWLQAGLETLAWIAERQTAAQGHFRPVGSDTFQKEYEQYPFDQQPLEAQASVEAAHSAFLATGDRRWIDHGLIAYRWYFGANDRGEALADLKTGRCRDGVNRRGVNENCGAESILAFHLAYASLIEMLSNAKTDGLERMLIERSTGKPVALAHS